MNTPTDKKINAPADKKTIKTCVDCKIPITYGNYIRCFNCNRNKWIEESNLKLECLMVDE